MAHTFVGEVDSEVVQFARDIPSTSSVTIPRHFSTEESAEILEIIAAGIEF